jgi:hypothetical protein
MKTIIQDMNMQRSQKNYKKSWADGGVSEHLGEGWCVEESQNFTISVEKIYRMMH